MAYLDCVALEFSENCLTVFSGYWRFDSFEKKNRSYCTIARHSIKMAIRKYFYINVQANCGNQNLKTEILNDKRSKWGDERAWSE